MRRREFLIGALSSASAALAPARAQTPMILKTIPADGAQIPALGMGSWLTFDVGSDAAARAVRRDVLETFFTGGGRLIDSSPMYGSSQEVIGWRLQALGAPAQTFAADKVWPPNGESGPAQIERSRARWGVEGFHLLQVHNLVDWRAHLETLFRMKAEGRLKYVGVTTYAGLRHSEIEQIIKTQTVDFVQLTYNVADREAEARLLPLAADRGVAVIANRPFREGALFARTNGRKLPEFAQEIGAESWAQLMLKFVISHPAVTCAIPATRRVDHMRENMRVLTGEMIDREFRDKIAGAFAEL